MASRKAAPLTTEDTKARAVVNFASLAVYFPKNASPRHLAVVFHDMGLDTASAIGSQLGERVTKLLRDNHDVMIVTDGNRQLLYADYYVEVFARSGRTSLLFKGYKVERGHLGVAEGGTWDQFVEWATALATPDYKKLEGKLVRFHYRSTTHPAGEDRTIHVETVEDGLLKGIDAVPLEHRSFRIDRVVGDILVAPHTSKG